MRFTPSEKTKKRFEYTIQYHDPKPGGQYRVTKILNDVWVHVDNKPNGFYWKDFTLVRKFSKDKNKEQCP